MECPNCRMNISNTATFCIHCGNKIDPAYINSLNQQQVMQQPMNQGYVQGGMQQPMNQGYAQGGMQQPMNQGYVQGGVQQPMNQGYVQGGMQQPMNQGYAQGGMQQQVNKFDPMTGQPINQGVVQQQAIERPFISKVSISGQVGAIIGLYFLSGVLGSIFSLFVLISIIPALISLNWFFTLGDGASALCNDRPVAIRGTFMGCLGIIFMMAFTNIFHLPDIVDMILSIGATLVLIWFFLSVFIIYPYRLGDNIYRAGKRYNVKVPDLAVILPLISVFANPLLSIVTQSYLNKFGE